MYKLLDELPITLLLANIDYSFSPISHLHAYVVTFLLKQEYIFYMNVFNIMLWT